MLLAAVLPVLLVSWGLSALFLFWRSDDLEAEHGQRLRLVARQLAVAAEYPLFVGNAAALQPLVLAALQQNRLERVLILGPRGEAMVRAGDGVMPTTPAFGLLELAGRDRQRALDWVAQPVLASTVVLDDLYEDRSAHSADPQRLLGQVVLVGNRREIDHRQRVLLAWGVAIGLLGGALGAALAWWLSSGVLAPVRRVHSLIEHLGHGDFAPVLALQPSDWRDQPLGDVQAQLRAMAERMAHVQQQLKDEVETATRALQQRTNEAEAANLAKSQFLASASHDLRQPLQAMGMFVSRLGQMPHDAVTSQIVLQIEASVHALQDLLDGLLDLSRLQARAVQVRVQPIALRPLLQQSLDALRQQALERGLHLRLHVADPVVLSDQALLKRMLDNLLGNALKYTERGGILLAARSCDAGRQVRLQVWDTGLGIASDQQAQVFREFYRVDVSGQHQPGLGLGLSIVQRSAKLLGHTLSLRSKPGRGSVFELRLPQVALSSLESPPANAAPAQRSDAPLAGGFDGERVLVVEDDVLVRSAVVGLLAAWGLRVSEAPDGASALQQVAAGLKPDLLLFDYRLPGRYNGIELVARVREQLGQALAAVLISGDTDPDLIVKARGLGLVLLHKPVRPAKLRALLRQALRPNDPTPAVA